MFRRLRSLMLGIILGLLFSPGTGMENRRRFWVWLQAVAGQATPKVQSQLQQVATKGSAVASQTLDQARQQVAPITQLAQEKLSTAGQTAQQKIGQVTSQATSRLGGSAAPVSPPPATGVNPAPTAASAPPPATSSAPAPVTAPTAGAATTGAKEDAKTAMEATRAAEETDGQKRSGSAPEPAGPENKAP